MKISYFCKILRFLPLFSYFILWKYRENGQFLFSYPIRILFGHTVLKNHEQFVKKYFLKKEKLETREKSKLFCAIYDMRFFPSSLKKSWEKQRSASYCRSRSWRRMRKTRSRIPLPQSWLKPACRPTLVTFTKASWSSLSTWGTSRSTAFRRPFWRTKKVSKIFHTFFCGKIGKKFGSKIFI